MADVLRCLDRWKRTVVLPEVNWEGKILLDHPELIGNELAIEQALVAPDILTIDRDYPDREVCYRRGVLPPPDHDRYLKVCVGFRSSADGEVGGRIITAYAIRYVKPGERIKWRR